MSEGVPEHCIGFILVALLFVGTRWKTIGAIYVDSGRWGTLCHWNTAAPLAWSEPSVQRPFNGFLFVVRCSWVPVLEVVVIYMYVK